MCISIKYWLLTKSDTWMQFLLILENSPEKLKPGENLLQNRIWPVGFGVRQLKIFSCITSIALSTFCINLLKKIILIQPHVTVKSRWENLESCTISSRKTETLSPLCPTDFAHLPASFPQLLNLAAWPWLLFPISSGTHLSDAPARPSNYWQHTIPHQKPSWVIQTWNKRFSWHKVSRKSHWSRERRSYRGAQEENLSLDSGELLGQVLLLVLLLFLLH